jgi:hypothetical protein
VKDGPDDYYVLLRRNPTNDAFQGYMLTGREMKEKLAAYEAPYTKNRQERKFNLCLCLYVDQALHIEKEDLESLPLERMRKRWPAGHSGVYSLAAGQAKWKSRLNRRIPPYLNA